MLDFQLGERVRFKFRVGKNHEFDFTGFVDHQNGDTIVVRRAFGECQLAKYYIRKEDVHSLTQGTRSDLQAALVQALQALDHAHAKLREFELYLDFKNVTEEDIHQAIKNPPYIADLPGESIADYQTLGEKNANN